MSSATAGRHLAHTSGGTRFADIPCPQIAGNTLDSSFLLNFALGATANTVFSAGCGGHLFFVDLPSTLEMGVGEILLS